MGQPTVTPDGQVVTLMGNVDLPDEIDAAVRHGARGVGLLRTEFLVTGRAHLPSEDEQYEYFRRVAAAFGDQPVVVRTYDLGGDKFPAAFTAPAEANPFLGWRSIRVCLDQPEIFRPQLRAILRAAADRRLDVMLPLITRVEEVERAREMLAEEAADLAQAGIRAAKEVPVGVMIEIPAAAYTADLLAREVDFFTIGTNDLIQYCLAVDRADERVSRLYEPLHPAILRIIVMVRRAAARQRIPVSLCGEMASDPALLTLLVGLGLTEFSMTPGAIAVAKQVLAELRSDEMRAVARRILRLPTVDEIERELLAALGRPSLASAWGPRGESEP